MLINESFDDLKTSYGTLRVHVFTPSMPGMTGKPKYPAVLVFSEIYQVHSWLQIPPFLALGPDLPPSNHQVTEPIRRFCRMVCGRGFLVAAPEIYHEFEAPGTPIPYDDEGTDRGNRYKIEKELRSYDEDRKTTIDYLMTHPQCTGAIGAAGICIGGHLAWRASLDPRIRCAALIEPTDVHAGSLAKGKNADSLARVAEIKGELLVIFGSSIVDQIHVSKLTHF
jgi:carboxymethylenebutenolidase